MCLIAALGVVVAAGCGGDDDAGATAKQTVSGTSGATGTTGAEAAIDAGAPVPGAVDSYPIAEAIDDAEDDFDEVKCPGSVEFELGSEFECRVEGSDYAGTPVPGHTQVTVTSTDPPEVKYRSSEDDFPFSGGAGGTAAVDDPLEAYVEPSDEAQIKKAVADFRYGWGRALPYASKSCRQLSKRALSQDFGGQRDCADSISGSSTLLPMRSLKVDINGSGAVASGSFLIANGTDTRKWMYELVLENGEWKIDHSRPDRGG